MTGYMETQEEVAFMPSPFSTQREKGLVARRVQLDQLTDLEHCC